MERVGVGVEEREERHGREEMGIGGRVGESGSESGWIAGWVG